jgi:hypothetical protein
MQFAQTHHRGFRLLASTERAPNGLHAANVSIERQGGSARTFIDLDYFYNGSEAVEYATIWGRIWIDANDGC